MSAMDTLHHLLLINMHSLEVQDGAVQLVLWGVRHAPAVAANEQ